MHGQTGTKNDIGSCFKTNLDSAWGSKIVVEESGVEEVKGDDLAWYQPT